MATDKRLDEVHTDQTLQASPQLRRTDVIKDPLTGIEVPVVLTRIPRYRPGTKEVVAVSNEYVGLDNSQADAAGWFRDLVTYSQQGDRARNTIMAYCHTDITGFVDGLVKSCTQKDLSAARQRVEERLHAVEQNPTNSGLSVVAADGEVATVAFSAESAQQYAAGVRYSVDTNLQADGNDRLDGTTREVNRAEAIFDMLPVLGLVPYPSVHQFEALKRTGKAVLDKTLVVPNTVGKTLTL